MPDASFEHGFWRHPVLHPAALKNIAAETIQEADFHLLADGIPTLCWIGRSDGYILWFNKRWHDYCGTTAEAMEGWGWQAVHDPAELPHVLRTWRESIATGAPFEMVFSLRGVDGVHRPFLTRVAPTRNDSGQVVRWFGVSTEITTQVRAQAALRDSEARFRAIANYAYDWESWVGPSGRPLWINPGLERLTGYEVGQCLRMPDYPLPIIHPDDRERMRGHFAGALRGDSGNDEPFRIVRSDGTVSWGAISWQPIFDPAGRAVGYRSSVRDITQRKQVEEALRQSEQHIRTLLHEVNHRSKNLLMLVQAIAKRTAESRPEDFLARFVARIRSLVASQDLLLDSEWKCVQIEPLIRSQLAHLEDLFGTRIAIEGPSLSLTPSAAQSLGMAVHELATNASKYGALSNDAGRLSIVWMLHQRESGPRLEVTWTERDGPPVCAPTRRGFGTTVVSDMAKAAFNASVLLNYAPEGLTWRVECDAGRVLAPGWADPEP